MKKNGKQSCQEQEGPQVVSSSNQADAHAELVLHEALKTFGSPEEPDELQLSVNEQVC
jgi:hypothetical protein